MTVYMTLLDGKASAEHVERREFPNQPAVVDWFSRYLHGFTDDPDPNPHALVNLYDTATFGVRITQLSAIKNPDGTYRIVDRSRGDRIHRGFLASGIDLDEAGSGYLAAQLRTSGLSDGFGIADIPAAYRATVMLGIGFVAGSHPLATRMWLRRHDSRAFGHYLYLEHSDTGGFWRSSDGELDDVNHRLEGAASLFPPQRLRRNGSRLLAESNDE